MPTVNYDLPTPADGSLVSEFPDTLRQSNIKVDAVLKAQGDQVSAARQDARDAKDAAIDAAGLVGTPPDDAIAAAVGAPNSNTRHNVSAAIDTSNNPAFGNITAALLQCMSRPVPVVFLGSSTTAAADQDPSDRYVNILVKKMQMQYAVAYGAETPVVGGLAGAISTTPGVHGYNFGDGGLTSRTFLGAARVARMEAIQPSVVFMSIGANDAVYSYTAAEVKNNVLDAIAAIDAVVDIPPTYVLLHQHELDMKDISALWAEYREALRAISIDNPHRVAFIDASKEFSAIGIPGPDPYMFRQSDHVHLKAGGQQMLGEVVARKLGIYETRTHKRLLARDYFVREENTDIGMADTGQRWLGAENWTVLDGGAATKYGGGTPLVWLDTPDMDVRAVINFPSPGVTTYGGVCVRSLDINNRLAVLTSASTNDRVSLYSVINGVQTVRWNEPYDFEDGKEYTLCVAVKGREMNVYINGELIKHYLINPDDQAVLGAATGAGFHSTVHSGSRRYKRFRVYEAR